MKIEKDYLTYYDDRECKLSKCHAPIPDQAHATRLFCPREVLPDGTVKNCKDDYWAEIKKAANNIYDEMGLFHKNQEELLAHLYCLNLPELTLDVIESTGIELSKSLMHYVEDGVSYFYFINYLVTCNHSNKQLKLTKHENEIF